MKKTMPRMVLRNEDGAGELITSLRPESEGYNNIRIGTDHHNNFVDLGFMATRALRDWLTEWLDEGVPVTPSYDENVTNLVANVKELLDDSNKSRGAGITVNPGYYYHGRLTAALAPFLPPPDPDAELVEKMAEKAAILGHETHDNEAMRALLAVVRAHDKEHP